MGLLTAYVQAPAAAQNDSSSMATWCFVGKVMAFNSLIAVTLVPLAVVLLLFFGRVLRDARAPVAVLFSLGYVFFELAVFCLERNWSKVAFSSFWLVAGPFWLLMNGLCWLLAARDVTACLLLATFCLAAREAVLHLLYTSVAVGGYERSQRIWRALTRGSAYGAALAALYGGSYLMLQVAQDLYDRHLSTVATVLLCLVSLPLMRTFLRLALGQAIQPQHLVARASASQPLDALVIYADVAYAAAVMIEVPYAFALLLLPHTSMFWIAAGFSTVLDVFFVYIQEAFKPAPWSTLGKAGEFAPSYCHERPAPVFAALASGFLAQPEATEATRLDASQPLAGAAQTTASKAAPAAVAAAADSTEIVAAEAGPPQQRSLRTSLPAVCTSCTSPEVDEEAAIQAAAKAEAEAAVMSPRVSLLLDEFDRSLIGCSKRSNGGLTNAAAKQGIPHTGAEGLSLFFLQEQKISLMTHSVAALLAVVVAGVCCPVLAFRTGRLLDRHLHVRALVLLLLRLLADASACRIALHAAEGSLDRPALIALWDGPRLEFTSCIGWMYQALISVCATFAVAAVVLADS
eukprot:TRINITY_DN21713_c0_g1_i1.p1 TRINITY_DN21713_c0_g1~~TRINITY_DN21713_c0_g1_i1.p1  ORF type:complete len:574 (+),score=114.22 TRINITY_DN21713_c0_g1_i1:167-1888(+)